MGEQEDDEGEEEGEDGGGHAAEEGRETLFDDGNFVFPVQDGEAEVDGNGVYAGEEDCERGNEDEEDGVGKGRFQGRDQEGL